MRKSLRTSIITLNHIRLITPEDPCQQLVEKFN
jgi:hypothetical protein